MIPVLFERKINFLPIFLGPTQKPPKTGSKFTLVQNRRLASVDPVSEVRVASKVRALSKEKRRSRAKCRPPIIPAYRVVWVPTQGLHLRKIRVVRQDSQPRIPI